MADKEQINELSERLAALKEENEDPEAVFYRNRHDRRWEAESRSVLVNEGNHRTWEYGAYGADGGSGWPVQKEDDLQVQDDGWEAYDESLWKTVVEEEGQRGSKEKEKASGVGKGQELGGQESRKSEAQGARDKRAEAAQTKIVPSLPASQPEELVRALRDWKAIIKGDGYLSFQRNEIFRVVRRDDDGESIMSLLRYAYCANVCRRTFLLGG